MSKLVTALEDLLSATEAVLHRLQFAAYEADAEAGSSSALDAAEAHREQALARLRELSGALPLRGAPSDPRAEWVLASVRSRSDEVLTALRERQSEVLAEHRNLANANAAAGRSAARPQPRFVECRV